MKLSKKQKITAIVSLIVAGIVAAVIFSGKDSNIKVAYNYAKAEIADISTTVTATGTIEPVTKVEVGTQVSGIVSKLYVDYNSVVKAGEVIAELDKSNLISELNSAKANLSSAKAELSSRETELNYQKENYNRQKTLHDKGLISDDAFDQAYKSYTQAVQSVSQQRQQVVTQGESVRKATTNLGYATITSPIDGVVLSKEVEEGQTVASSFNTPTLFTIAKDLTDMRVIADVDEADIGEVKEGARVTFTVDAYPNDTFEGEVTQVRQEATTTNNVVTYEVVISAPNNDLKLKPGLTANVTIFTAEKQGVLCVPSKALRFTPTPETVGNMKIQDTNGKNKVWTKEGNTLKAHNLQIGMSDGINTEVLSGISEGTVIVTGMEEMAQQSEDMGEQQERSPFAPGPPGRKKK